MTNTMLLAIISKHKNRTTNIHNLNNLADISIQGRRFTHTLRVLSTVSEGV